MASRPVASQPRLATIGSILVGPLCLLGYGNDIDVANVLRAGDAWLSEGVYRASRPPGAPVHELGTALLDHVGGSVAVALGSVAFGVLAVWAVTDLVRSRPGVRPALTAAVLVANPWFVIASTSLNDATWSLGLALAGSATTARGNRHVGAVLFGLAIGCRASTILLVGAWIVAERFGDRARRPPWRATLSTVAIIGAAAALCFVPPWWAAGQSLSFTDLEIDFVGWGAHLGRWGVKNIVVITLPGLVALGLAVPSLVQAVQRWSADVTVRFAVLTVAVFELLFLRFPLKPVHLLPVVAGVVLLIAGAKRSILLALVVAQVIGGLVSMRLVIPDTPDRATGADVSVGFVAGALVDDVRCRLRDRDGGPWPSWSSRAAVHRSAANFACQNRGWRGSDPHPVDEAAAARPWPG